MFIKMDTDNVRAMSSRMRQTADLMDAGLVSINQVVTSAGWQSQAREEFIMHLEMVRRSTAQSTEVLRMMAQAAEEKANQWEAIGNVFNGPFYFLRNIWGSVKNFFGGMWGGIRSAINSIRIPSLPNFVFPALTGAAIIGWFNGIVAGWDWEAPDWWPFGKNDESEKSSGGGAGGSRGGGWGPSEEETGDNDKSEQPRSDTPSGETSANVDETKPYPQPPTSPKLSKVSGNPASFTCATYAKARRPDLGSTQSDNEKWKDQAAANYISKFEEKSYQLEGNEENLKDVIGVGYAVAWEPDPTGELSDKTYGHVAIVEEVYGDHVIISEAVRNGDGVYYIRRKTLSFEQLNNDLVWLIA